MNITLKSFAEEVSLDGSEASSSLVFITDTGRIIRVPVPKETIHSLVQQIHSEDEKEVVAAPRLMVSETDTEDGATEFGADEDPDPSLQIPDFADLPQEEPPKVRRLPTKEEVLDGDDEDLQEGVQSEDDVPAL